MRTSITTLFALAIFFLVNPPIASAQDATCLAYGPGTGCTTSTGAVGVCNDANECQVSINNVTPSNPASGGGQKLINPLQGGATLESFLISILNFVIRIGTVVVILMLVYVGYLFVVARGNPGEIETAKKALLWTLIGALILLGSKAIAIGIEQTVQALSAGR